MIVRGQYMKQIRSLIDKPVVKVITGMRRAGKSALLELTKTESDEALKNSSSSFGGVVSVLREIEAESSNISNAGFFSSSSSIFFRRSIIGSSIIFID